MQQLESEILDGIVLYLIKRDLIRFLLPYNDINFI